MQPNAQTLLSVDVANMPLPQLSCVGSVDMGGSSMVVSDAPNVNKYSVLKSGLL